MFLKKINFSHIPYIVIIILLIVLTCKNGKNTIVKGPTVVKTDTVYREVLVRDTIKGKTVYIKGKKDTVWLTTNKEFIPKTTYDSLLQQYMKLGGLYFHTNVYRTKYEIPDYGYINVIDTVSENWLVSSEMQPFLNIPEKTITITEQTPPKRQLYIGAILTGTKSEIMNSANVGLLYKDKRDRLYGGSIGTTSQGIQLGIQSYFKIKLKK